MPNLQPSIDQSEHVGAVNGESIEAKRVAGYQWDGAGWVRNRASLFKLPYDSLAITYTDTTKETISSIITKLNGVTQETLTVTYPSGTEEEYTIT